TRGPAKHNGPAPADPRSAARGRFVDSPRLRLRRRRRTPGRGLRSLYRPGRPTTYPPHPYPAVAPGRAEAPTVRAEASMGQLPVSTGQLPAATGPTMTGWGLSNW